MERRRERQKNEASLDFKNETRGTGREGEKRQKMIVRVCLGGGRGSEWY